MSVEHYASLVAGYVPYPEAGLLVCVYICVCNCPYIALVFVGWCVSLVALCL